MVNIENLLLDENDKFLNYSFKESSLNFVKIRRNQVENFWSFLTENKNYKIGDFVIDDIVVSNKQSINYSGLLYEQMLFIDDNIWIDKKTTSQKLIKKMLVLYNSLDKYNQTINTLINTLKLGNELIYKTFLDLTIKEKIIIYLTLSFYIGKKYNFISFLEWYDLNDDEQKEIFCLIEKLINKKKQAFILITTSKILNDLDENNIDSNRIQNLTISTNINKKINKLNPLDVFNKVSSIIFYIYKWPYIVCLLFIFISLTISLFFVYNTSLTDMQIITDQVDELIVWLFLGIAIFMVLILTIMFLIKFKIYRKFIRNIQFKNVSKITCFCYFYLLLVGTTQLISNCTSLLINLSYATIVLNFKCITMCIFINIGFIIGNLALSSLWILIYNR